MIDVGTVECYLSGPQGSRGPAGSGWVIPKSAESSLPFTTVPNENGDFDTWAKDNLPDLINNVAVVPTNKDSNKEWWLWTGDTSPSSYDSTLWKNVTPLVRGETGEDGKSAYQIWLDNGGKGTETDFLNSLKGDAGEAGESAYQAWLDTGNTGSEAEFLASLKAPKPYINPTNKHWIIDGFDTGVVAEGARGAAGSRGDAGISPHIDSSGYWFIGNVNTGVKAQGAQGVQGIQGIQGKSNYQLWLEAGNTGSVQDFLKSLNSDIDTSDFMQKSDYDPTGIDANVYDRANHVGVQPISSVTDLQSALDQINTDLANKYDLNTLSKERVKSLYESNPNTNAFTDSDKARLDSAMLSADMEKSVYDPNNIQKDVYNPENTDYSSFDDQAVLGVQGGKVFDTGLRAKNGHLETASNSVTVGDHTVASAGENIMWRNERTKKVYDNPWQDVTRDNIDPPRYRMYTDSGVTSFIFSSVDSTVLTDPEPTLIAPSNLRVWSAQFKPAARMRGVTVSVISDQIEVWKGYIGDLNADSVFKYDLESVGTPIDVYKNQQFDFKFTSDQGDPIKFYGDPATNRPYMVFYGREWEFVDVGNMKKSDYDTNNDGKVDIAREAESLKGVGFAGSSAYYGTDVDGNAGFYPIDEKVDLDATVFSNPSFAPKASTLHNKVSYLIYDGSTKGTLTLPSVADVNQESQAAVIVLNRGLNSVDLDVIAVDGEVIDFAGDKKITLSNDKSILLIPDTDKSQWYSVRYDEQSGGGILPDKVVQSIVVDSTGVDLLVDYTDNTRQLLPIGDMKTTVYDLNGDGVVDKAGSVDGIAAAGNNKYYGTNGSGTAGFHDLPTTSGGGNGDMTKAEYDSDNDGRVDEANIAYEIAGGSTAGNNKYYGTNNTGQLGFNSFPILNFSNDVETIRYSTSSYTPQVSDILNQIPYFVYEGTTDSTFNLIPTSTIPENTDSILTVSNKSPNDVSITLQTSPTDTLENRSGATSIKIPKGDTISLASNRVSRTWYIIGGLVSSQISGNPVKEVTTAPNGKDLIITYSDDTTSTVVLPEIPEAELNNIRNSINILQQRGISFANGLSSLTTRVSNDESRVNQLHSSFVFYDTVVPTYPASANGYYFITLYALSRLTTLNLPSTTPALSDGTQFFLKNMDNDNSVRLAAPNGQTVKGSRAINVPARNFWWGIKEGDDWKELLSGYIAPSYTGMISDVKAQLKADKAFISDIQVMQADDPSASVLHCDKLEFTGCTVSADPLDQKRGIVSVSPIIFVNPDGQIFSDVQRVKLVGMELKPDPSGIHKLYVLDNQNIPAPVDTSAYAFFDKSPTAPDNVPFQSLPVFRGGRVTVHKDTTDAQYAYVLLPPNEGTATERIGELGGLPAYWSKESKDYTVGGQSRTYTVFRSPYAFHEQDLTLVLYP